MNTRLGLALLAATISYALVAQPVIDQDSAPVDGEVFHYTQGNYMELEGSGGDLVWDLSGVGEVADEQEVSYVDPAVTGLAASFPNANMAVLSGNVTLFYRVDGTGMYQVGQHVVNSGTPITILFDQEMPEMPYPCTMGTAMGGHVSYTYPTQGYTVNGSITTNATAEGYGTLILPHGTVNNVLLIRGTTSMTESIPAVVTIHQDVESASFYRPGLTPSLAQTRNITATQNGEPAGTGESLFYLNGSNFAGMREQLGQDIGIMLWPVPAQGRVQVEYGLPGGRTVQVELFDATGKLVRQQQEFTSGTGIQLATMDLHGLTSGLYMLSITDRQGQRGTSRLVVE